MISCTIVVQKANGGLFIKEEHLLTDESALMSSELRHHSTPTSVLFLALIAKAPDQVEKGNMCLGIVSRNGQYVFWVRKSFPEPRR